VAAASSGFYSILAFYIECKVEEDDANDMTALLPMIDLPHIYIYIHNLNNSLDTMMVLLHMNPLRAWQHRNDNLFY
jgi:hypothetical protein